ncbi:MAG: GNAT family N-acetyltransferase [Anaerolineales bacterium]
MRYQKLAALGGILGPILFASVVTGLTIVQYDFMRGLGWEPIHAPTFDWPSGLSLGPYGIWMTLTFILSGSLMAIFALALRTALDEGTAPRLGTLGLLLAGCALMGLAFSTDPTLRSTPATWHGRLHDLSFVLLGLFMLLSMLGLGRAFQNDSRWRGFGTYTFVTAACALPSFALKGIAFYLFLGAILTWSVIVAIQLFRLSNTIQDFRNVRKSYNINVNGGNMIRLVPMTVSEFEVYLEKTVPEYAADKVGAGHWSEEEALERSRKSYDELLPQGIKTENNYLFRIQLEENGEKIGIIWMKHEVPRPHGFIYDIALDEAQRGKGYGKQTMLALEEFAKELGIETLALNVFMYNTPAMKLYKRLGYEVTSQNMAKQLI